MTMRATGGGSAGESAENPAATTPAHWQPADSVLLETLIHEAPVAFAFYDANLRYRRINRLLADINGLPIGAHIGRRPSEVLDAALGADIELMLRRVLEGGEVLSDADFRAVSPDSGEMHVWQSQWFPARGEDGTIIGVAVIVVDITERLQSQEALVRSHRRIQRLQQVTAELASAMTVADVARVVGAVGRSSLGARWSAVCLLTPDGRSVTMWGDEPSGLELAHGGPRREVSLRIAAIVATAIRSGRPVYVASHDESAAFATDPDALAMFKRSPERAWAVVPLRARDTVFGALRFTFAEERVVAPEDRVFLEALGGQCAIAIERARLYERVQLTAETLQASLLPDRLPSVPGLELAARYLPGGRHDRVGGDWYDVFALPSGRTAVVVGDVMGKGVPAAAGMGRIRSALRALALTDESPAAVLTGLDRLVTATEDDEQIVTLFYAVADPLSGLLRTADAGHPPVVLARHGEPPVLLGDAVGTTPLGLPEPRYEVSVDLRPGDVVIGYSDGLVETRQRDIGAGLQRLLDVVASVPADGLEGMVNEIVERMVTDEPTPDDVTVLALRLATIPVPGGR